MLPKIITDEYGISRLRVDGKEFPILGGELHNSSSSSLEYMHTHVWPWLQGLDLNTVLLPVTWEAIEPSENDFDFTLVEGLIRQAKDQQMKLVLLWFGLWKNGESHYVPLWVKKNTDRFTRVIGPDGKVFSTISPFCDAAIESDKKAFSALMAFLRENDSEHTVIMVQIENEMGILGADRDHSVPAQEAFQQRIPECITELYGKDGTWERAFGADAAEVFMAWRYATVIEKIAAAGKGKKDIPMYVNAWLEQHPDRAGIYPSGGPVAKLIPLWKKLAPSVDMVSPDIYEPQFGMVCREYAVPGNPLFIPEAARNAKAASRAFYAFGGHHAIGFCPFGVEMLNQAAENAISSQQLAQLNIMEEAMNASGTAKYLPASYRILKDIYSRLEGNEVGFIQEHPYDRGRIIDFEKYSIQLDYMPGETGSGGIILPEQAGFYIAGCGVRFSVLPPNGSHAKMEILRYEEGGFIDGKWIRGRILNGDELWDMSLPAMPSVRYIQIQAIPAGGVDHE